MKRSVVRLLLPERPLDEEPLPSLGEPMHLAASTFFIFYMKSVKSAQSYSSSGPSAFAATPGTTLVCK